MLNVPRRGRRASGAGGGAKKRFVAEAGGSIRDLCSARRVCATQGGEPGGRHWRGGGRGRCVTGCSVEAGENLASSSSVHKEPESGNSERFNESDADPGPLLSGKGGHEELERHVLCIITLSESICAAACARQFSRVCEHVHALYAALRCSATDVMLSRSRWRFNDPF